MAKCVLPTPGGPKISTFSAWLMKRPVANSRTSRASIDAWVVPTRALAWRRGADVFGPFFTKKGGVGFGLALCRQVADAHGGHVALEDRRDGAGCVARVRLPRA